jgi:hypothetical protein
MSAHAHDCGKHDCAKWNCEKWVPWKRALEGTVIVIAVQFFVYYIQFMATDTFPVNEVLLKTFLALPFLLFFMNWAQFAVLGDCCCEASKDVARGVIGFGGIAKALVVTWATTPIARVEGARAVLVAVTFLVAVAAFFLVGYEGTMNLTQPEERDVEGQGRVLSARTCAR